MADYLPTIFVSGDRNLSHRQRETLSESIEMGEKSG